MNSEEKAQLLSSAKKKINTLSKKLTGMEKENSAAKSERLLEAEILVRSALAGGHYGSCWMPASELWLSKTCSET